MQCNVPEHCWRLQTAKFAPTTHACAPRVLLKYSRDSRHASQLMKSRQDTNYSITSMEVSRFARQSEVSRMHLHGDRLGGCVQITQQSVRVYMVPKRTGHMARTRSSHQALKKRLMKQATPYKKHQGQGSIEQSRPPGFWEFQCLGRIQRCWHGGFRCLSEGPTRTIIKI